MRSGPGGPHGQHPPPVRGNQRLPHDRPTEVAGRYPDGRLSGTLVPELREHLDAYAGPDSTALVFTGQRGGVLRRGNFRRASGWLDAVAAIGLPGLHFHDLRHTGNTLAAQAGVSLADLKARMGHDSVRAAMIYQHAAAEADQKIANTLDQRMGEARDDARDQS